MFGLGIQELMVILIIVLVLFGATRLPEIGKGVGQAIRNFKKGMSEVEIDVTPNHNMTKKEENGEKKINKKI